jgi:lysophospholipase L1-like esterase
LNARRGGNDTLPPTQGGNDTLPPNSDQSPDRADSNTPNLAHLQDAVRRANGGGAPVRILQYGDSHVAGGTEPKSIEAGFSKIAPVDYSTMAKVGISASYPLQHEQSWINQPLQDKKPDLVILSFGSNDAAGQVNKQAYERQYEQLVQKIHQQSPNSSIMIVGPTDGYGSGTGKPLPGLDNVIAAQKEVAAKYGLDFVDMRASMGGAGSINDWRARGLAAPDKLHFTTQGYQLIAQQISNRLQSDVNGQGDYA